MAALIDAVHLHVSETKDTLQGKVGIQFHILMPESLAGTNPHPVAIQQFPGYRSLGKMTITVDPATAAGIARGSKFVLQPKTQES